MNIVPEDTPALLTIEQFRRLAGISRGFAYELVRTGVVPSIRLGRVRGLRIPKAGLADFLDAESKPRRGADGDGRV